MKKIIFGFIVLITLTIPITGASEIFSKNTIKTDETIYALNQESTHSVLVEYGTMTTCPPCVTANAQLYSVYDSGDLDFNYVTLVWDRGNSRVRERLTELNIFNVPDVYFDGKFNHVLGGQTSEQTYRNAITQAGERDVPDIDIDMDVSFTGGSTLKIKITVLNNEPDVYEGYLRTYIVEKVSRWNDYGGNPYHFAVLDIPIDKSLSVVSRETKPIGETYTFERTWRGFLNGFSDIKQDNIRVITTVFDAETDFAIKTAMQDPTSQSANQPFSFIIYRILGHFPILKQICNSLFL